MATYYTVKKGDTLSKIAASNNTTVTKLANLNDIDNVNLIYVGQKLLISGAAATPAKKNTSSKPIIKSFGLQSDTDRTVFVTWKWDKDHTKEYRVIWYYYTGDGVAFVGSDSQEKYKQSTYNAPSNATAVKVKIKPISTTHTVNKKEVNWWTADWSAEKKHVFEDPPEKPSVPKIELIDASLSVPKVKVSVDNLASNVKYVHFQVVKNDKTRVLNKEKTSVSYQASSITVEVAIGGRYKVRCRAVDKNGDFSEWTEYSEEVTTLPENVTKITSIKAKSPTYVFLDWEKAENADSYEIEYTTKKAYFESNPSEVRSTTVDNAVTHAEITGLETGSEYFFRVRAVNANGPSKWTGVKSIKIGKAPAAPTTWSSTTTAVINNDLYLYWVHNSEDGSSQTGAQIEIIENGVKRVVTKTYSVDEETEVDLTKSYHLPTKDYTEGHTIEWRVRTKGITSEYSEWSTQRTIDVYQMPYVELDILNRLGNNIADLGGKLTDTIFAYPFTIKATAGPKTQKPIGYHVSIASTKSYETTDNVGNTKIVSKGDVVYSKYLESSKYTIEREMTPSTVDLAPDITYKVTVTVSMDSGLRASISDTFKVIWDEDGLPEPNATIGVDPETLEAVIRPYCERYESHYYKLTVRDGEYEYRRTSTVLDMDTVETMEYVPDAYVKNTRYQVYSYTTNSGESGYCADIEDDNPTLLSDVTLSVYRREYDGTFTKILTKMINSHNNYTIDPHPALDYARYRIVATSKTTGENSYFDAPAYPVAEKAVVINWDEEWSDFFDYGNPDEQEEKPFTGSMLKLPYNIDVSSNHKPDVELVEYIGRRHPVGYYGTQVGETATWNMEIPKSDVETLYALRRLAIWMDDVYVREPSGSGYWANITVSFDQKHKALTIPVTFNITRVEGGK